MIIYQYANPQKTVIRDSAGNFFPTDTNNRQYREFLKNNSLDIVREYSVPSVDLKSFVAATRYNYEIGGIMVNGIKVASDDRSKTMIIGARAMADSNKDYSLKWKLTDGTFITIDAYGIIAISNAVLAHVQKCFDVEGEIINLIDNKRIRTTTEVLDRFKLRMGY